MNAENVVNPPRSPVNNSSRVAGENTWRYSASPLSSPITKHPARLTAIVPYGKRAAALRWVTRADR
jgi:hypothetical protein